MSHVQSVDPLWKPSEILMASKRAIRRRACGRKRRHSTIDLAYIEVAKARESGHHVIAYRCKFCRQFHVGHEPRKTQRAREHGMTIKAQAQAATTS